MRNLIAVVVLLAFAVPTALHAQEATPYDSPDGEVRTEMVQTLDEAEARIDARDAQLDLIEAEVVEITEEREAPQTVAQPTTQWWWLVGAVVVAGLVLALLGVF